MFEDLEPEAFLTDKRYDVGALIEKLEVHVIMLMIPPIADYIALRGADLALYREHNLIEQYVLKLRGFRAIATRYDKLAKTFLAAVQPISVPIWHN